MAFALHVLHSCPVYTGAWLEYMGILTGATFPPVSTPSLLYEKSQGYSQ